MLAASVWWMLPHRVSEQVMQQINQTSEPLLSDLEGEAAVEALLVFLSICYKVVTSR